MPDTETFLDVRARLLKDGYRRLLIGGEVRAARGAPARGGHGRRRARPTWSSTGSRSRRAARGRLAASLEQAWAEGHGDAHSRGVDRTGARRGAAGPGVPDVRPRLRAARGRGSSATSRRSAPARPAAASAARWTSTGPRSSPTTSLSIAERRAASVERPLERVGARKLVRFAKSNRIPLDVPWRELRPEQREAVLEGEGELRRRPVPRTPRLVPVDGAPHLQDARARAAQPLPRVHALQPPATARGSIADALRYRVGGLDLAAWHRAGGGRGAPPPRVARHAHRPGRAGAPRAGRAGSDGWRASASATSASTGRAARSPAARRSGSRSPRRSAPGSPARSSSSTSRPSGCTPRTSRRSPPRCGELARRGNAVLVLEHDPALDPRQRPRPRARPRRRPRGRTALLRRHARRARRAGPTSPPAASSARTPRARPRGAAPRAGGSTSAGASANNLADLDVRLPLGVLAAVCRPERLRQEHPGRGDRVPHAGPRARATATSSRRARSASVDGRAAARPGRPRRPGAARSHLARQRGDLHQGLGRAPQALRRRAGRRAARASARRTSPSTSTAGAARPAPARAARRSRCSSSPTSRSSARAAGPAVQARGARGPARGPLGRRRAGDDRRRRRSRPSRTTRRHRRGARPARSAGPRLPPARPAAVHALRRRGAAGQARPRARRGAGGRRCTSSTSRARGCTARTWRGCSRRCTRSSTPGRACSSSITISTSSRSADWLIDLGPGGGREGGRVVAEGTPEEVAPARDPDRRGAPRRRPRMPPGARAPCRAASGAPAHRRGARPRAQPHGRELQHPAREAGGAHRPERLGQVARWPSTWSSPRPSGASPRRSAPTRASSSPPCPARTWSGSAGSRRRSPSSSAPRAPARPAPSPPSPRSRTTCGCSSPSSGRRTARTTTPPSPRARRTQLLARGPAGRGHIELLAPVVRARKGTYLDVFTAAARAGVREAICDGAPGLDRRAAEARPQPRAHHRPRRLVRAARGASRGGLPAGARAGGRATVKVLRARAASELLSSDAELPALRHRRPRARPALVLLQHRAGPVRGLRGHRRSRAPRRSRASRPTRAPPARARGSSRSPAAVRLFGRRYAEVVQQPVVRGPRGGAALDALAGTRRASAARRSASCVRRLEFLERVGLGYLSLDRAAATLSGGEMQRLRLSAQAGAGLTGALYVLDEPTIGLHPRDTGRLLENLRALVDTGSTVLVVEHDLDTIRAADHLVDLGPGGGRLGGRIVAAGTPSEVLASRGLAHRAGAPAPGAGAPAGAPALRVTGSGSRARAATTSAASTSRCPLGRMTVVAGVSGSGKSTLVRRVLFPAVREALGRDDAAARALPAPLRDWGRSGGSWRSTSHPSAARRAACRRPSSASGTSCGGCSPARPRRGPAASGPARFSFNSTGGGRCPTCAGQGAHQPRDVVPPRRHHALRGLRRRALRAGDARGPLARAQRRRGAAPHGGRGARGLRRAAAGRGPAALPRPSWAWATCSSARGATRSPAARRSG